MNGFLAGIIVVALAVLTAVSALGASPVCNAFPGGFSAGSVSVGEVLKRASDPKGFDSKELAPIDAERPAAVEVAQFGLG